MTPETKALLAAADEMAEAFSMMFHFGVIWRDETDREFQCPIRRFEEAMDALTEYRAAREAITKGTPPAYATSA